MKCILALFSVKKPLRWNFTYTHVKYRFNKLIFTNFHWNIQRAWEFGVSQNWIFFVPINLNRFSPHLDVLQKLHSAFTKNTFDHNWMRSKETWNVTHFNNHSHINYTSFHLQFKIDVKYWCSTKLPFQKG